MLEACFVERGLGHGRDTLPQACKRIVNMKVQIPPGFRPFFTSPVAARKSGFQALRLALHVGLWHAQ
jgi:hypothetical protein